jgi:sphingomyelin phosphodiesterase
VWLIGHIPPSTSDANRKISMRVFALIERYQHIIRFQAYGHKHKENYTVTRSLSSGKPIGVEFTCGSAGTYDGTDPVFRLYEMHAQEHVPLEFSTFLNDIEQSNIQDHIVIERWIDFKREFEMEDLSPSSHLLLS